MTQPTSPDRLSTIEAAFPASNPSEMLWEDDGWSRRRLGGVAVLDTSTVEPPVKIPADQVQLDFPEEDDGETVFRSWD